MQFASPSTEPIWRYSGRASSYARRAASCSERASALSMIEAIKVAAEYVVAGVWLGDPVAQAAE